MICVLFLYKVRVQVDFNKKIAFAKRQCQDVGIETTYLADENAGRERPDVAEGANASS